MQEIFFTILTIWVLFKIFGPAKSPRFTFNTHQHHYAPPQAPKEGEIKVQQRSAQTPRKDNYEGEYVDFEEVKD
jgi:hypothetical protein